MKMRTRKVVAILLSAAMIFGMDSFAFAAEIKDDAAVETVTDEAQFSGTGEEAELSAGWFADSVEIDGWHMPERAKELYNDGVIELSENEIYLQASTEARDLKIKVDTRNAGVKTTKTVYGTQTMISPPESCYISSFEVYSAFGDFMDTRLTNSNKKLTVTLASNNDPRVYGYKYLRYKDGNDYKQVSSEKELEDWAKYVCKEGVKYSLDLSKINEYVICTFYNDEEYMRRNNKTYGYVTKTFNGGTISYNSFASFLTISNKNFDKLNLMVYADYGNIQGQIYLKKYKFKHKKSWGNKVRLYVSKLSITGKKGRALKKAINKAKIDITVYPYDLSGGEYGYSAVSLKKFKNKSNGKHELKLREDTDEKKKKTYTLKNGTSDGWGGKVELTPSGNGVTVSGSNMFTGFISK